MRNLGPVPLGFQDKAGDKLGPEESPASIFEVPDPIPPHHTDTIVAQCEPLEDLSSERVDRFEHRFKTNDPDPVHNCFRFGIVFPVLSPTRCENNDGCRKFALMADNYSCATCGCSKWSHGYLDPEPDGPVF